MQFSDEIILSQKIKTQRAIAELIYDKPNHYFSWKIGATR